MNPATPHSDPFSGTALPHDAAQATLIGRLWLPGTGPVLVRVTPEGVYDLSALALTCSELLERGSALSCPRGIRVQLLGTCHIGLAQLAGAIRADRDS